jgi:hypothetical protein
MELPIINFKKSQLKELLMAALVLFQMLSYQKLNKNSIDLENPFSVHAVMKSTILTTVNYQATSYPARNQSIENTLQNA